MAVPWDPPVWIGGLGLDVERHAGRRVLPAADSGGQILILCDEMTIAETFARGFHFYELYLYRCLWVRVPQF